MDLSSLDLGTIVQIITGIALITGLVFGLIQFRQYQAARQREKIITLWQQFQTPNFYRAVTRIGELEPGLSIDEVEKRIDPDLIDVVLVTWYTVGVLVHQGALDFNMICDNFADPIIMTGAILRHTFRRCGRSRTDQAQPIGCNGSPSVRSNVNRNNH